MHELEESISSTESSYVEPSEPKDDRIKLRHEVELETNEDEIRNSGSSDLLSESMVA